MVNQTVPAQQFSAYTGGAGTVVSNDYDNISAIAAHIVIDVTALSGTSPTYAVTLQGKDSLSGKYYTILASSAQSALATTVMKIGLGMSAVANLAANDMIPRTWRISTALGGTVTTITGTVAVHLAD